MTRFLREVLCILLLISNVKQGLPFATFPHRPPSVKGANTKCYNFLKNALDNAFANDRNLPQNDKRTGQLDSFGTDDSSTAGEDLYDLTETQRKWRQMASKRASLDDTVVQCDFFLSGIPDKDPSNDLFGSRTNISSRDRATQLILPETPTLTVQVAFLPGNKCRCLTATAFTSPDSLGDWKISEDGKLVRFRIEVAGYARTVETRGTIQNTYWSKEKEKRRQTSTTYRIPAGWLYGEASLTTNARGELQWQDGILKIEKTMGLLGVATKMLPCGRFAARFVDTLMTS